ncbi:hypothetical protein EIP91_008158 [Steccherinum ochraceum]|uniref:N-acetyltransferase domain-containing protein n=1 Tax=Steccherinum ochraceum TaxID=92696 RepID=A0A4R0RH06_9APHY|nr:hypothetical protein EIP91_008158 [Steccherinum ochraceum]
MYTTERLVLRAWRESDLDEMHAMWNEAGVQLGAAGNHIAPRGLKWRDTYRSWLDNNLLSFIIETKEDTPSFVGHITIHGGDSKNRNGEISMTLKTAHWGKGYGTEVLRFVVDHAFRMMNVHRVSLGAFDSNDRALALYTKVGFVVEGRVRKSMWVDGEWRDLVLMGILDEEWAARQAKPAQ